MRGGLAEVLHLQVPWMAWPSLVKKTAFGMGALSHCLLYQILFIEVAV